VHPAARRTWGCVVEEVRKRREETRPVAGHECMLRIAQGEFKTNLARRGFSADHFDGFTNRRIKWHWFLFHAHLAAENRGHIEQVIYQALQGMRISFDYLQAVRRLFLRQQTISDHVNPTDDRCE